MTLPALGPRHETIETGEIGVLCLLFHGRRFMLEGYHASKYSARARVSPSAMSRLSMSILSIPKQLAKDAQRCNDRLFEYATVG